ATWRPRVSRSWSWMARAASAPTTSSRHEQPETTISAIATSTHATHIQQRVLRVVVCAQLVPHLALPSSFSGCRRWEYSERGSLCPLRASPDTIEGDVRLRSRDTVNLCRRGTRRSQADRVPWWSAEQGDDVRRPPVLPDDVC